MQSRILKLQEISQHRKTVQTEYDAMRQAAIEDNLKNQQAERINYFISQVPLRFRGKNFADFQIENDEQGKIKTIAERYVQSFKDRRSQGTPIKMIGRSGTGKTFLSLLIYQSVVNKGYSARYESSLEFINKLLAERFNSKSSFESQIKAINEVDLLIIDEATESINKNGTPTDSEKNLLFRVIDQRYQNHRCTIIITNRDNNQLVERLGEPTVSRLTENGIAMAFNWKSYRN